MLLGDVQGLEVVVVVLHLGTLLNGEAQTDEDVLQVSLDQVQRMNVTHLGGGAGHGDVQLLLLQTALQGLGGQSLLAGGHGGLDVGADLIGDLTHHGALLGGQLAHTAQDGGQLALLTQILDAKCLQISALGVDGGQSLASDLLEIFFHAHDACISFRVRNKYECPRGEKETPAPWTDTPIRINWDGRQTRGTTRLPLPRERQLIDG